MSINSSMTAIADRIRILLGISVPMGLDAMASNLETEVSNVASAFSAVVSKGGTLPSNVISGNLVSAIASIPAGVNVQRKSGSFTTNTSGAAAVSNLGFKPDLVVIKVGTNSSDTTQNDPAFAFTESGKTKLSITSVSRTSGYEYTNTQCTQSSTGFSVAMLNISGTWATAAVRSTSFNYIAVKYT